MKMNVSLLCATILAAYVMNGLPTRYAEEDASRSLTGTSWQLVKFVGGDDTTLTPNDKTKYTVAFAADGSVSARIDCNRGHGVWKSSGPNQLEFVPLALTRAMCPPAPLNDRLARDWSYVRSYVIKNGHLFLSLMADAGIYEFEPVSPAVSSPEHVKGTAGYRERMALPSNVVFEAFLEDVSRADASAEVIGKAVNEHPGNPPIAFEIPYDPSLIDPSHSYAVRARILAGRKLLFTTDQNYAVLTEGHGNEVALLLKRVTSTGSTIGSVTASNTGASTALENTNWKLTRLGDTPVSAASPQQQPNLILDSKTQRVSGSSGCNRMTGSYHVNGDELTFSQMAGTMMACISGMDTETTFLQALGQVKKWRVAGNELELLNDAGSVVAHFEAVAPEVPK